MRAQDMRAWKLTRERKRPHIYVDKDTHRWVAMLPSSASYDSLSDSWMDEVALNRWLRSHSPIPRNTP